jgi:hypothetical protein
MWVKPIFFFDEMRTQTLGVVERSQERNLANIVTSSESIKSDRVKLKPQHLLCIGEQHT